MRCLSLMHMCKKSLLKANADVSSMAEGLNFSLSLHLRLYFLYVSNTDIWFKREAKNLV